MLQQLGPHSLRFRADSYVTNLLVYVVIAPDFRALAVLQFG